MIKKFIHQFASPKTYLYQVNRFYPYIFYSSLVIYIISLIWGLFFTPEDFVQGNSYRIIYLHVPASFLSQSLYLAMAVASVTYLVWRVKLAAYLIIAIAPIGAMTTFIALISGSIWGIPTWGTWWQWDARITSTLILFIMYLGLISLHNSFSNFNCSDRCTYYIYSPHIWINLGNTYMGYLVAMGCKNNFDPNTFFNVFGINCIT